VSDRHRAKEKPRQAVCTEAVEGLLVELRVIDPQRVDTIVRHYEETVGPKTGAWASSLNKNLTSS